MTQVNFEKTIGELKLLSQSDLKEAQKWAGWSYDSWQKWLAEVGIEKRVAKYVNQILLDGIRRNKLLKSYLHHLAARHPDESLEEKARRISLRISIRKEIQSGFSKLELMSKDDIVALKRLMISEKAIYISNKLEAEQGDEDIDMSFFTM